MQKKSICHLILMINLLTFGQASLIYSFDHKAIITPVQPARAGHPENNSPAPVEIINISAENRKILSSQVSEAIKLVNEEKKKLESLAATLDELKK